MSGAPSPGPADKAMQLGGIRLSALIESMDDEVWFADKHGKMIMANPSARRQFRLGDGEIGVEALAASLEVLRPDGTPRPIEETPPLRALAGETVIRQEEIVRTPLNGELRCRQVTSNPVRDASGEIIGAVSVVRDITDQKRAEDDLKERDRQITTLVGNLPGMAYRCRNDKDWTMEYISEGAAKLTGYAVEDLRNSTVISYAQVIHPDDRELVWEAVQKAVRARTAFELNYRIVTAGGDVKWMWEQGCGVFSYPGELLALEGFITDISSKKKAEEALL